MYITNNDGLRKGVKPDGNEFHVDPIHVQRRVDPENHSTVTIREDLVMIIDNQDKTSVVQHADGTKFFLEPKKTDGTRDTRIECACYATVTILFNMRFRLTRAELPGGTWVQHDTSVTDDDITVHKPDGTACKMTVWADDAEMGEITYEPGALHPLGRKKNFDETKGIWHFQFMRGDWTTTDPEGSIFTADVAGYSKVELSDLDTYKDYECSRGPRLFLVNDDGSATEWMSQTDNVTEYIARCIDDKDNVTILEEQNDEQAKTVFTFLHRHKQVGSGCGLFYKDPEKYLPNTAKYLTRTLENRDSSSTVVYRHIILHHVVDEEKRQIMETGFNEFSKWRAQREKTSDGLVLADNRTEEEREAERLVQMRIKQMRQNQALNSH
eukprot:GFYU01007462.1.p1 GENE.GFYU01007462.1~~GFYU01007462.1.p1  ORF type:complete len:423 (+),score=103.99 GFYU01007462.1:126-1271(+)